MGRPRKLAGEELVVEFLSRQKKRLSPGSISEYRRDIIRFLEWIKLKSIKPLDVVKADLTEYLDTVLVSRPTTNRKLAAVRAFYGFLRDSGRVISNPADGIRRYKVKRRLPKALTRTQVEQAVMSAGTINLMWATMFMVMYYTGMRRAEAIRLSDYDIDYDRREIRVIGKGDKERLVRFPPRLATQLAQYKTGYLNKFTNPKALFVVGHGDPVTANMVEWAFRKVTAQTGFKVHPHTLRHCLHPDTLVIGQNGPVKVSEVTKGDGIATVQLCKLTTRRSPIISALHHPWDSLVTIQAGGFDLSCTPEHTLFTFGAFGLTEVQAGALKPGDYIVGLKKLLWQGERPIGTNRARILGYFMGDGCFNGHRGCGGITLNDKRHYIAEYYANLLSQLNVPKVRGHGPRKVLLKQRPEQSVSWVTTFHSTTFAKWILDLGCGRNSRTWKISPAIYNLPAYEIAAFLAGFYDAEGSQDRVTSCNDNFLKGIQLLLLRLGIRSSLEKRVRLKMKLPNGKVIDQVQYDLFIKDGETFWKQVHPLKPKPAATVDRLIYYPTQSLVKEIIENKGKILPEDYGIHEMKRYTRLCTKGQNLDKFIAMAKDLGMDVSFWEQLPGSDITPLKVTSIKETKAIYDYLYDFETRDACLVTNGILSHNSFATHALRSGMDIKQIQYLLGHQDISTTSLYLTATDLSESYDKSFQ